MRINLQTPFAEKEQAKALGARWDATKKTWYVVDVEDLTPFIRWIPEGSTTTAATPPGRRAPVITKPLQNVAICTCAVLPWEDCPHSRLGEA